jgi:hypothetical protein
MATYKEHSREIEERHHLPTPIHKFLTRSKCLKRIQMHDSSAAHKSIISCEQKVVMIQIQFIILAKYILSNHL